MMFLAIIAAIILFILLPFPIFFVLAIIGGAIAGWIYEGKKISNIRDPEEIERRRKELAEQRARDRGYIK